jgi:hypothetical protein
MDYSTLLDHSAETLMPLDQSSMDVRPIEDLNGVPYPTFGEVRILEVLCLAFSTNRILVEHPSDPGHPNWDSTCLEESSPA